MMVKHWCKTCFKAVVDDTASDKFILMSGKAQKCPSCGQIKPLVMAYFKYGEHTVSPEGTRIEDLAPHQGINPNFSYWGTEAPYLNSNS